jgi:hypothetical protein
VLQAKIEQIARLVRSLDPVDYPEPLEPQPCGAGVSSVDLAEIFTRRLNDLRAPGDAEPAVLNVADITEAAQLIADLCRDVPPDDIVWPGGSDRRPLRRDRAVGVTPASVLIAATGSVILNLPHAYDGYASLLVDRHVVVAGRDQLVADLPAFYRWLSERLAAGERLLNQVCITGCSRTADIEKLLVIPAHGPRQILVILSHQSINWQAFLAALNPVAEGRIAPPCD